MGSCKTARMMRDFQYVGVPQISYTVGSKNARGMWPVFSHVKRTKANGYETQTFVNSCGEFPSLEVAQSIQKGLSGLQED